MAFDSDVPAPFFPTAFFLAPSISLENTAALFIFCLDCQHFLPSLLGAGWRGVFPRVGGTERLAGGAHGDPAGGHSQRLGGLSAPQTAPHAFYLGGGEGGGGQALADVTDWNYREGSK